MASKRVPLPNLNQINKKEEEEEGAPPKVGLSEKAVQLIKKRPTYLLVFFAVILFILKVYTIVAKGSAKVVNVGPESKMQAIFIQKDEGLPLYFMETNKPEPNSSEVLIQVRAFGISRTDLQQREGSYIPEGENPIMGIEFAGTIVKIGSAVRRLKPGDRVFGLSLGGGSYAEYTVADESFVFPLAASIPFEQGASLPESLITAYKAIYGFGGVNGQKVLIHGAAGGLGSIMIQMTKLSGASEIIATVSSQEKAMHCERLGATKSINYRIDDFQDQVLKKTNGEGVDLIIDIIGGEFWTKNLGSLTEGGRLLLLGTLSGSDIMEANIGVILRKKLTISGWDLRTTNPKELAKLTKEVQMKSISAINRKVLKPVVDTAFPWLDIIVAHQYLEENANKGKVVAFI